MRGSLFAARSRPLLALRAAASAPACSACGVAHPLCPAPPAPGPRSFNGVDNGFLQLDHVRIPRDAMLMRYAQVCAGQLGGGPGGGRAGCSGPQAQPLHAGRWNSRVEPDAVCRPGAAPAALACCRLAACHTRRFCTCARRPATCPAQLCAQATLPCKPA